MRQPRERRIDAPRPFVRTPWRGRAIGFGLAALAALTVALFAPAWLHGSTRTVAIYDAGAIVLTAAYWIFGMHDDSRSTAMRAAVEDPGRNVMLTLVLASVVAGLVSAILILGKGPAVANAHEKLIAYAVGIIAVVVGWVLIHTVFTFRYAHLYYFDSDEDGSAQRGLTFPGTEDPDDYDFAYFSFVIGMTFQVSDVAIKDAGVRRIVLVHALISFTYNTMIVALVINLVSGLFH